MIVDGPTFRENTDPYSLAQSRNLLQDQSYTTDRAWKKNILLVRLRQRNLMSISKEGHGWRPWWESWVSFADLKDTPKEYTRYD